MKKIKEFTFISHEEFKLEMFKKPGYKKSYNALEPEFAIVGALIKERIKYKLTQRELAKKIGIAQSALARFESGKTNPTLAFMQKMAYGLGLTLTVKPLRA